MRNGGAPRDGYLACSGRRRAAPPRCASTGWPIPSCTTTRARVELALGAFYWKAEAGDTVTVSEYQQGAGAPGRRTGAGRTDLVALDPGRLRPGAGLVRAERRRPWAPARSLPAVRNPVGRFLLWLCCMNLMPLICISAAPRPGCWSACSPWRCRLPSSRMNNKYFVYALFVTIVTTFGCWVSLVKTASGQRRQQLEFGHSSGGYGGYGGGYSGGAGTNEWPDTRLPAPTCWPTCTGSIRRCCAMPPPSRRCCAPPPLAAGARILHGHFHTFGRRQGVTGVLLLAESHISIHTWPEAGFAAVDIFMCGECAPAAGAGAHRGGAAPGDGAGPRRRARASLLRLPAFAGRRRGASADAARAGAGRRAAHPASTGLTKMVVEAGLARQSRGRPAGHSRSGR
jgi:hypothetical protein